MSPGKTTITIWIHTHIHILPGQNKGYHQAKLQHGFLHI